MQRAMPSNCDLRVLTLNTLGSTKDLKARASAIVQRLEDDKVDIACFQNVSSSFRRFLDDWAQHKYTLFFSASRHKVSFPVISYLPCIVLYALPWSVGSFHQIHWTWFFLSFLVAVLVTPNTAIILYNWVCPRACLRDDPSSCASKRWDAMGLVIALRDESIQDGSVAFTRAFDGHLRGFTWTWWRPWTFFKYWFQMTFHRPGFMGVMATHVSSQKRFGVVNVHLTPPPSPGDSKSVHSHSTRLVHWKQIHRVHQIAASSEMENTFFVAGALYRDNSFCNFPERHFLRGTHLEVAGRPTHCTLQEEATQRSLSMSPRSRQRHVYPDSVTGDTPLVEVDLLSPSAEHNNSPSPHDTVESDSDGDSQTYYLAQDEHLLSRKLEQGPPAHEVSWFQTLPCQCRDQMLNTWDGVNNPYTMASMEQLCMEYILYPKSIAREIQTSLMYHQLPFVSSYYGLCSDFTMLIFG
jgi:hypothetical protein